MDQISNIKEILEKILLQLTECLQKETQWELGRIAEQVLPQFTETAFFIDINILEELWNFVFIRDDNLLFSYPLCLMACKTLKFALKKVAFLEEKPLKLLDKYWSCLNDREKVVHLTERIAHIIPLFVYQVILFISLNSLELDKSACTL